MINEHKSLEKELDKNLDQSLTYTIERIQQLLTVKESVIIGIDGNCASGKTTIASLLGNYFPSIIIHMDDFFLPSNLRSKERYEEIGGNIHYERFLEEVDAGIKGEEKSFSYRIFSCKAMDYVETVTVDKKPVIIIEGAYSLHPRFRDMYDLKIFSYAPLEVQKERILRRNGEEELKNFVDKWIPLEEKYFREFRIKEECSLMIEI